MRAKLLLFLCVFALLSVTLTFAQIVSLKANIPFGFIARGKTLPAGQYSLTPSKDGLTVDVAGTGKAETAFVPVITRLGGAIHTSKQDAHIVFDDVGGVYTLSEIWIPGEDGFLLFSTKGKHQHRTVDVPR